MADSPTGLARATLSSCRTVIVPHCHCEEQSDEAISRQLDVLAQNCFVALLLAMTVWVNLCRTWYNVRQYTASRTLPAVRWSLLAFLALVLTAIPLVVHAKGGGGGGGGSSIEDEDDEFDDDSDVMNAKPGKQRKPPSHFAIKTAERFGMRHQFDSSFSLEPYVRGQQNMLDNPLAIRGSAVAGGLVGVYKFGDAAWTTSFETKQVYSDLYAHTQPTPLTNCNLASRNHSTSVIRIGRSCRDSASAMSGRATRARNAGSLN